MVVLNLGQCDAVTAWPVGLFLLHLHFVVSYPKGKEFFGFINFTVTPSTWSCHPAGLGMAVNMGQTFL